MFYLIPLGCVLMFLIAAACMAILVWSVWDTGTPEEAYKDLKLGMWVLRIGLIIVIVVLGIATNVPMSSWLELMLIGLIVGALVSLGAISNPWIVLALGLNDRQMKRNKRYPK